MHDIVLEKILPNDSKEKYPKLVAGARACPPEDCGGIGGYENLLEVLNDPNHEEHQNMLDWLGIEEPEEFDPEEFIFEEVYFENPKKRLKRYEKFMKN